MTDARRGLATQARVGVFVLAALLVFVGLIYLLGAGARLFESKVTLYAEFTEVGGLLEGATVRLAGVQIGRVTGVFLPEEPGGKVRVELRIARQFLNRIRRNSVARIETQGLLGDRIVEVVVGSASEPAVSPGSVLASREPSDIGRMLSQSGDVVKAVSGLAESFKRTTDTINESQLVQNLAAGASSARRIGQQIEQGRGLAHALVYEEAALLRRLDQLLASTQTVLRRTERGEGVVGVLTSPESTAAAKRFVAAMDRLGTALEAKGGGGLLTALLFDPKGKDTAEDLRVLARNLRDVSERLSGGRGTIGALLKDDGSGESLRQITADLKVAVANLRAVTDKLNSGEGTLGALIVDPTVYENLATVLEGSQRSLLLRSLIKGLGNKGRDAQARQDATKERK